MLWTCKPAAAATSKSSLLTSEREIIILFSAAIKAGFTKCFITQDTMWMWQHCGEDLRKGHLWIDIYYYILLDYRTGYLSQFTAELLRPDRSRWKTETNEDETCGALLTWIWSSWWASPRTSVSGPSDWSGLQMNWLGGMRGVCCQWQFT